MSPLHSTLKLPVAFNVAELGTRCATPLGDGGLIMKAERAVALRESIQLTSKVQRGMTAESAFDPFQRRAAPNPTKSRRGKVRYLYVALYGSSPNRISPYILKESRECTPPGLILSTLCCRMVRLMI